MIAAKTAIITAIGMAVKMPWRQALALGLLLAWARESAAMPLLLCLRRAVPKVVSGWRKFVTGGSPNDKGARLTDSCMDSRKRI